MEQKNEQKSTENNVRDKKHVPEDEKVVAGVLALFFGGLGIHKFYLGRNTQGILYLLFAWTLIPAIIALIDAVLILSKNRQLF